MNGDKLGLNNPANYKRVKKKQHQVYCCMPLARTSWKNILDGTEGLIGSDKRFVLSGTVGETSLVDAATLAKNYRVAATGEPITDAVMRAKFTQDKNKQTVIDWFKLVSVPDTATYHVMFLPVKHQVSIQTSSGVVKVNRPGIEHGEGDFIVCADDGSGRPNLNNRWVVNGAVFPTTYDMRAFPAHPVSDLGLVLPVPKSIKEGCVKKGDKFVYNL